MEQYKKPEDYKGKSVLYPMPKSKDPRVKTSLDFHYAAVNSLMAYWADGKFIYNNSQGRSIQELWDYAQGRQNMDKIKGRVTFKKNEAGRFITKMNVSWEGYAKLPQLFDTMRAKNMSQEYDADMYCIDNDSIAEREKSRDVLKWILDENTKAFVARSQMKPNFDIDPEKLALETQDDVDMYFDSGSFTLQWEMAALAAIQKSKSESNYKEFQDLTFDNLIINTEGFAGARTYYDKSDGIPKVRTIDVKNALCPYFKGLDSKGKISRAGEMLEMTIADISKANPDLTIHELKYIAKKYAWMNPEYEKAVSNTGFYARTNVSSFVDSSLECDPVFNVKVLVLDYQFISEDVESFLKHDERKLFKNVDYGYEVNKKAEKKGEYKVEKTRLKRYEGLWIVGTKYFISYGESMDVVYTGSDGNKTPELDFHFVKTGNMSLIERAVAIIDDMNMALIKERNVWATIPAAPAMIISKRMVENVFMNGKKVEPEQLLSDFIEKGVFYIDGYDEFDKPIYGINGNKPIDFINVQNIIAMLSTASQQMAIKVNELKELLGLQGGVDGGAMDRYQGLGQTQLAFEAANSSLAPTFNAFKYLFKNVMLDLVRKWQIKARKQKDLKIPYSGLGAKSMKMLAMSSEFSASEFNVEVTIQPTMEEKANLLSELRQLRQASMQTGGSAGLSASEYIYAYEQIMAGNMKGCMYILGKIEAKKASLRRQQQIQDQEYNIQSNRASGEAKTQGDLAIQELKNEGSKNVASINQIGQQLKTLTEMLVSMKEGERINEPLAAAVIQQKQAEMQQITSPPQEEQPPMQMNPDQLAQSNMMANNGVGTM